MKNNNLYKNLLNLLEQYKNIIDINTIVTKSDLYGNITYANDKFCKISEYSKEELLGKSHNIVRHPDVPKKVYKDMWKTIKNKKPWFGKIKNKSKSGKTYYVDVLINPILDEQGDITEYISLRYDISALISYKYRLLDDIKDLKKPLLVVLQIRHYNQIKKFYKRKDLTNIKKELIEKIIDTSPKILNIDKIYKLSNGRFAFLKDLEKEELTDKELKRSLKKFHNYLDLKDLDAEHYNCDIQLVLAYTTERKNIYQNIMNSLFKIEEKNKKFICCDGEYKLKEEEDSHNINIIKLLKNALSDKSIKSLYQPIVCNKTNTVVKYESLVRLNSSNKVLTPNLFLDIAKKAKYYHHITNNVLVNTFKDLRKIEECISVNISSLDIENIKFRLKTIQLLEENKDIANRLTFEILEDEEISYLEEVESFISEVKEYGVKIAVDDFGIGYSNFSRLKIFKPDFIKIDGSLIKNIEHDKYSLDLVKTIQEFSKSQDIKTIAEFVSNKEIYDIIKDIGIDYSQGYYFGKPRSLKVYKSVSKKY